MKLMLYSFSTLLFISITCLQAQDYLINFTGSGASTTVANVKVENLTQGTSLTMNGSDVLYLMGTITGIETINDNGTGKIVFYPNPMTDYAKMQFELPEAGETVITLYDISGKKIVRKLDLLFNGQHTYEINGLESGMYFVRINSGRYLYSGKLLCSGSQFNNAKIIYENISAVQEKQIDLKGATVETEMQYNTGDRILFKGISDIYSTVITDVPTESKTITFYFIPCTDGDGNNYLIVKTGSQVWMAENLKTTKYNDGTDIPLITDKTAWSNLSTPGYCWYSNDSTTYAQTYGALYNWYTVNTGKLCPIGWHVPTDEEWTTLTYYLGGESVAGGKLKETGTAHWLSPNTGATNETGFTALPGGYREYDNGSFYHVGSYGILWSANDDGYSAARWRGMYNDLNWALGSGTYCNKHDGFSIRCIRNDIPTVTTNPVINITSTTATTGGEVISDGGAAVTARGVCWGTNPNPTVANSITIDGSGTGTFTSYLTDLVANNIYYLRAYATNNIGTAYSDELSFKTTFFNIPTVYTDSISEIKYTSAKSGGSITSDGGSTVTARGVCWSTSIDPTIDDNKTIDGAGVGSFASNLTDLTPNTSYFVRAYATNAIGTSYGLALAFTTLSLPSTVGLVAYYPFIGNANDESGNGNNGTVIGATLTTDRFGKANNAYSFDGIDDEITGSVNNWPLSNTSRTISLWIKLKSLPPEGEISLFLTYGPEIEHQINSIYFHNNLGYKGVAYCGYMDDIQVPFNYLVDTWYNVIGTFDGTIAKIYINGQLIAEANKSNWNTTAGNFHIGGWYNPVGNVDGIIDDIRIYNRVLTDFELAFLFNEGGFTGSEMVSDIDGNSYNTVRIGNQVWIAENLKTTKYNDGVAIPLATDNIAWQHYSFSGAYCWYNNDEATYKPAYGAIYNGYTVSTGKLCPIGWHVPTDAEWTTLTDYLGGESVAGGKLKEAGTAHWLSPNTGATNETGFTALPGGYRIPRGSFDYVGYLGVWWSATPSGSDSAINIRMHCVSRDASTFICDKVWGQSIRCVKD